MVRPLSFTLKGGVGAVISKFRGRCNNILLGGVIKKTINHYDIPHIR